MLLRLREKPYRSDRYCWRTDESRFFAQSVHHKHVIRATETARGQYNRRETRKPTGFGRRQRRVRVYYIPLYYTPNKRI